MNISKKKQIVVETLINKMFEVAGHNVSYNDIKERNDNWYQQWTMTEQQNKEWRDWGIKHIKKELRLYKHIAEREMAIFDLNYGLKIKENQS